MLEFIKSLAKEAGKKLLDFSGEFDTGELQFKNARDLVTVYDKQTEDFIVGEILKKYPDHDIFAEESGKSNKSGEYCWIIDPIDGTTSFVHQQPFYSISIALQKAGETILGLVYAPKLGEIFWAEKGRGAFMNGTPIKVSSSDKLINSVLATGFACLRAGMEENNLPVFCRVAPEIRGIRRYGSAAIDLAYTACGKLDGFWELNLKPYDIAAGVIILQEAGGKVTDFNGKISFPENGIIATNTSIHNELLSLINDKRE